MKEYGCCPKFKRRDNSTYTFTKRGVMYLVSTTPPKPLIGFLGAYYKCVKFHKNPISGLGGVAFTRYMNGRTDRVIPIYPPNFVCGGGGINILYAAGDQTQP
jgi:hypothetical protein